jgi:hypothetical protein
VQELGSKDVVGSWRRSEFHRILPKSFSKKVTVTRLSGSNAEID